jgi:hypothetical protein
MRTSNVKSAQLTLTARFLTLEVQFLMRIGLGCAVGVVELSRVTALPNSEQEFAATQP